MSHLKLHFSPSSSHTQKRIEPQKGPNRASTQHHDGSSPLLNAGGSHWSRPVRRLPLRRRSAWRTPAPCPSALALIQVSRCEWRDFGSSSHQWVPRPSGLGEDGDELWLWGRALRIALAVPPVSTRSSHHQPAFAVTQAAAALHSPPASRWLSWVIAGDAEGFRTLRMPSSAGQQAAGTRPPGG